MDISSCLTPDQQDGSTLSSTTLDPNYVEGVRIYSNCAQVVSDTTKSGGSFLPGDDKIVVGRFSTNQDCQYASVQIDELVYFNAALTSDDVQSIYNSV